MSVEREDRECPHCLAGPGGWHSWANGQCWCGSVCGHNHKGVLRPKACGQLIGFLRRLWRWCFVKTPHLHFRCTACGARWVTMSRRGAILQLVA